MLPMKEISLAPGVTLRTVQTQKFKTSILGVTFLEPLSEKTAALNALLPWVLQRGTQTHPDMESLSAATDDLYGGTISPVLRKKGEVQLSGRCLCSGWDLYFRACCPAIRGDGPFACRRRCLFSAGLCIQ